MICAGELRTCSDGWWLISLQHNYPEKQSEFDNRSTGLTEIERGAIVSYRLIPVILLRYDKLYYLVFDIRQNYFENSALG